jgi:hypothetical protein
MSDEDETEDSNRLQVFLTVERVTDGYIETNLKGEKTHYVRRSEPGSITLENLCVFNSINVTTGAATRYMTGITKDKFRAIGAEKAYKIFNVTLTSDLLPRTAKIVKTFSPTGHPFSSNLSIGVSEAALDKIALELDRARTARKLDVVLAKPAFYAERADAAWAWETLILPYWKDQETSREETFDHMAVAWQLEIGTITVAPLHSSFIGSDFGQPEGRSIYGAVGVQIPGDVKIQYSENHAHPLVESCEKLIATLKSVVTPLYIIAGALVIIVYKSWR